MLHRPLEYILDVARTGSIRAAAEASNVAGSAISRHIQLFEEMTGASLFERHARGMTLTPAGEIFCQYARTVIMEGENVRVEIENLNGLRRGNLRICTIDGIVSGPLSDAIATFRTNYPNVAIQLHSMGTDDVMEAVRNGEADIGIAFHTLPHPGIRTVQCFSDPLRLIAAPTHQLGTRASISFSEAIRYPLALPEPSFGIRKLLDAVCHTHNHQPNLVLETNSIEALRGFARSGAGISFLPHLSSRREINLAALIEIAVDEPILANASTEVVARENGELPMAAQVFIDILSETFSLDGN